MTTCLVLGGAACVWDDVHAFWGLGRESPAPGNLVAPVKPWDGVVACNEAGIEWPGELDAWVSLHPRFLDAKGWRAEREANGYPAARSYWSHRTNAGSPSYVIQTDLEFPGQGEGKSGSSGLLAAKVALIDLGFDRVVLCGVPMTADRHIRGRDSWAKPRGPVDGFRRAWTDVESRYRDRMRSMSGWTRILLGAPEYQEVKDAEIHSREYRRSGVSGDRLPGWG